LIAVQREKTAVTLTARGIMFVFVHCVDDNVSVPVGFSQDKLLFSTVKLT